ncbi:hypothetical protein AB0M91_02455 [Micromonospora rifamycinica]|uniref:hypothetical protein n=1 Tax=Micromonospora rifamycinica TaxID=291594 RepID=UPI0033E9E196
MEIRWQPVPPRTGRHRRCGPGRPPGQLLVLTPADAEARERLELLRVLGAEEFPAGVPH